MTLWFAFASMTAIAALAVLWPLARRPAAPRAGSDVAVYRDQLDEIDRDRANGLVAEREAEAARVEVSRRLIAAADREQAGGEQAKSEQAHQAPQSPLWRRRAAAVLALLIIPFGGGGLYLALGSPSLPGEPLAARLNNAGPQRPIGELIAQVETHLEKNPEDGRGWEVLAPVYMRLGRFDDAVKARQNALRLLGSTPEREADLGEAMAAAANGIVTADAKAAFDRAVAADSDNVRARYFLGLAAQQDGRKDDAARMWTALIASAPADAPWTEFVKRSLAELNAPQTASKEAAPEADTAAASEAAPGPNAADIAASSGMSADQRTTMIHGMVDRLAERLKQDGSDVDGWLRLVRAYMVLGERDKAQAAAAGARQALAGDSDKLRRLDDLVKGLGLEG